jgi:tetratricopeptide (TPR) repeat protein
MKRVNTMKKVRKKAKPKKPKAKKPALALSAWEMAEWDYTAVITQRMMPMLGEPPSTEEIIKSMEAITRDCPDFYPALLELGLRRLISRDGDQGEEAMDKGFDLMLKLAEPDQLFDQIETMLDNLEKLWRFDLSRRYLGLLVARYPEHAFFQDSLAHASARMGDVNAALAHSSKAIAMEPGNCHFLSNYGWYHLWAGNLEEAYQALSAAGRLDPDDGVVKGNFEVHRYLKKHGGNYLDYLLRPLDQKRIDLLARAYDGEDDDDLRTDYNRCRLEAFAHSQLQEGDQQQRSRLADLLSTLQEFLKFAHKLDLGGRGLHEDLPYIATNFEEIMHEFIIRFRDVDHQMVDEIYEALFTFYGFLAARGLVASEEYERFRDEALAAKGGILPFMDEYNATRRKRRQD